MPNVPMLELDEIQDEEIKEMIRQAEARGAPDPNYFRMMGHNPQLAKDFYKVWTESFLGGNLDHKLKEVIRVMMSRAVACSYWGFVRSASAKQMGLTEDDIDAAEDYENSDRFTEAEKAALRYAEQMQLDPSKIRGEFYDELRKYYTNQEIMELGVFVALNLGFHAFFSTLEFHPAWDHIGKKEKASAPA